MGKRVDKHIIRLIIKLEEKMQTYRLETKISKDGTITLPMKLKEVFDRKVQIVLKHIEKKSIERELIIPTYNSGGLLKEFTREELYEGRL